MSFCESSTGLIDMLSSARSFRSAPLAKAHAELDRAVESCYRKDPFTTDRERVEHLFRLYEQLTAPLLPASPKTRARITADPAAAPKQRAARTPKLHARRAPGTEAAS
jgi:hypothetical protein